MLIQYVIFTNIGAVLGTLFLFYLQFFLNTCIYRNVNNVSCTLSRPAKI
jgi:hypothetical protein